MDPFTGVGMSHHPMARAPKNLYSLTARYQLPIDASLGDVSVEASYWFHNDYTANETFNRSAVKPSYGLINASIRWDNFLNSPLDLGLWVKNAANEEYSYTMHTLITTPGLGFASDSPGEPRLTALISHIVLVPLRIKTRYKRQWMSLMAPPVRDFFYLAEVYFLIICAARFCLLLSAQSHLRVGLSTLR